jgi:hypothetical protein
LILFVRNHEKKKKKKEASLPDFAGIQPGFAGITVEGILEKKNKKWSRATHMTIVLSVIVVLTNRVLELKIFEILRGSIKKIETSRVELKIATNFGG